MSTPKVGDPVYQLHGFDAGKIIKVRVEHHPQRGPHKPFDHFICDVKTPDGKIKKSINYIFLKSLKKMVQDDKRKLTKNEKRLKEAEAIA